MNHRKKDRLFELVERLRLPVVLFAEGGGGRPGDTDMAVVTGLDTEAFALFGALSGKVPLVGVVSGRCFAGNAALLGCCHVIIATPDANIGMGGPAMIEGGGLGVYRPEEIGPVSVQVPNGVVDVLCADEKEAVEVARRYLAYFQGDVREWTAPDQDRLRDVVPPDRRRVYDVQAGGRVAGRRGVRPRAPAVVRPGHGDGAGPGRGPGGRGDRQQPDAPGRRHRRGQRRQGGPLPAAVRGLRAADPLAVRHAGVHGGARGGGDGARAPRQPHVRGGRVADRALRLRDPAQGLRAGRTGHGRRQLPPAAVHRGLADRRARRHGPRGGGAPRLPAGARPHRRPRRARRRLRHHGCPRLRAREGGPRGRALRDRRRDRPGRDPAPLRARPRCGRAARSRAGPSGRPAGGRRPFVDTW